MDNQNKNKDERLHARWIPHSAYLTGMKCSNCKARIKHSEQHTHTYCYKCGAIMDNGGKNLE